MASERLDTRRRLGRLLACAAVIPALRSILCFDLDAEDLRQAASAFAEALGVVEDRAVQQVMLGSAAEEDALWSRLFWCRGPDGLRFERRPGPLGPRDDRWPIPLIVVPDLPRLGLPAARACVAVMGADVVHLERHGQQARWRPRACWIAACPTHAVGQVSPHLLDRFAVRVSHPPHLRPENRGRQLDGAVNTHGRSRPEPAAVDVPVLGSLRAARDRRPRATHEALDRVLDVAGAAEPLQPLGLRRELALARLAVAEAKLDGAPEVAAEHVQRAAALLGLAPAVTETDRQRDKDPEPPPADFQPPKEASAPTPPRPDQEGAVTTSPPIREHGEHHVGRVAVLGSDAQEVLEPAALPSDLTPGGAYPEDNSPSQRELEPLRLPPARRRSAAAASGPIIGVERARTLYDLALTSTVIEALKFQNVRRREHPDDDRPLLLSSADLRCHRRAPRADAMLVLVLDHTSRGTSDWAPSLAPYLRWAYAERASVCVVNVGARDAPCELRAQRTRARNLLDPRIAGCLDAAPGRATPLAHGLELAYETLRHVLHHGSHGVLEAWLVVVTDGRGNVSLEASRAERVSVPVGRAGIEDALRVAQKLSALVAVQAVVIDSEPELCGDLPSALAQALDATLVPSLSAANEEDGRAA